MTIQMGGEMHTIDIPGIGVDEDVQLILLKAEPKTKTVAAANLDNGSTEDEKKKTQEEIQMAKK